MSDKGEKKLTWLVVVFSSDNSVEAVPNNWYCHKNIVLYPTSNFDVSKLSRKRQEPEEDWEKYDVTILGEYNSYEKAREKTKTAEDQDNLDTSATESVIGKKRKLVKNKKYISPSSSEKNSSSSDTDTEPPLKLPRTSSTPRPTQKCSDSRIISKNTKTTTKPQIIQNCLNLETISRTTKITTAQCPTQKCPDSDGITSRVIGGTQSPGILEQVGADKEVITHVPSFSSTVTVSSNGSINNNVNEPHHEEFQRQVLRNFYLIRSILNEHGALLNTLARSVDVGAVASVEADILMCLPLKTEVDLQKVEKYLESTDNFDAFVAELSLVGGTCAATMAKQIMYKVFANEVGILYTWEGKAGKKRMRDLRISQAIIAAVRNNQRILVKDDFIVITAMKKWLLRAKDRLSYKKK